MTTNGMDLPYLTTAIPGIGGRIKVLPQDFQVEEIPLYPCCGNGEHLYLQIEKCNISTFEVIRLLAGHFQISQKAVGYAGIKDTHAVARQYFSLPVSCQDKLATLAIPNLSVLSSDRHTNKLRVGHLQSNRFKILIREYDASYENNVGRILPILVEQGVPNYFGQQRFGTQANTDTIGRAILRQDFALLCHCLFGIGKQNDTPLLNEVKQLYQAKRYAQASNLLPPAFATEKIVLQGLDRSTPAEKIWRYIPHKMRHFYLCAYQSALYNRTLTSRIDSIGEVWPGDIAIKHPGRAAFLVEDVSKEQPRCSAFEISPSGPLFGYKILRASGRQGELEQQVLNEEGLDLDDFKEYRLKGERRSYRFAITQVQWEKKPDGLWIEFTLDRGCYATVVLREIMKDK